MSKYEELANLAVESSEAFFKDRASCADCAQLFMVALRRYLRAPDERINFVSLDEDLEATEEKSPKIASLRLLDDRHWHFGIEILFATTSSSASQNVVLKMAVSQDRDGFVLNHDVDFSVNPQVEESFQPILDCIFSALEVDFGSPGSSSPRRKIGFLR